MGFAYPFRASLNFIVSGTSGFFIEDFNESYYCILKCIGKEVEIATDNPKVLTYACVIRGKEEIEKELLHGNGKQLEYI